MAVNLSPIWGAGAQLLDNSGNVLSGGKIYTYAAGTTTQVATYTSNTGITANSNPIVLNSAGRVPYEIWLTDGQNYKFVLKDSNDVLIGTWDNLSGINSNFIAYTNEQEIQTATAGQTVFNLTTMQYLVGTNSLSVFVDGVNQYGPGAQYAYEETDSTTVTFASGLHVGAEVKFTSSQIQNSGVADASQISYTAPYTNSVTYNVEEKLAQYVSVKDFGAVGDGVTDDTDAINNALAAMTSGGTVYMPEGTYKTTDSIVVGINGVTLIGAGRQATVIKPEGTFNAIEVHGTSFASWADARSVQRLTIDGSDGCTGRGLSIENCGLRCYFADLYILSMTGIGMYITSSFDHSYERIESRANSSYGVQVYEKQVIPDGVYEEISWLHFTDIQSIGNNSNGTQFDCAGGDTFTFTHLKVSEGSVGIDFSRNCANHYIDHVMCDGVPSGTSGTSVVIQTSTDFCYKLHINNVRAYNCQYGVKIVDGQYIYVDMVQKLEGVAGADIRIESGATGPFYLDPGLTVSDANTYKESTTVVSYAANKNAAGTVTQLSAPIVQTMQAQLTMTSGTPAPLQNIVFPVPFPTACLSLVAQRDGTTLIQDSGGNYKSVFTECEIVDPTSFNVLVRLDGNAAPLATTVIDVTLIAVGY